MGCYLNLANPDEKQLRTTQDKYLANIRFAAHMGVGVVGTETGAPNTEYKFEEACWSDWALERLLMVYARLLNMRRRWAYWLLWSLLSDISYATRFAPERFWMRLIPRIFVLS